MSDIATVSARRLAELNSQHHVDLIDVRTPAEYQQVHADIARNVPLDSLDPHQIMASRNGSAEQPLYLICHKGSRSGNACQKFLDAGFTNVVSVEGGTSAWDEAGLPVVRGKKTISLERQVRIAAGALVLIGALLSFWSIAFAIVPAFVGAGLMFAGITDNCAMAMLLAKMPWNQA